MDTMQAECVEKIKDRYREIKFTSTVELLSIIGKDNIKNLNNIVYADSDYMCEDIRYIKHSYSRNTWGYIIHNLLNETYGKKNVPTIYDDSYHLAPNLYCPRCRSNHSDINHKGTVLFQETPKRYSIDIEAIECNKCHTVYDIRDIKLLTGFSEGICGDIFIDEDKISLSYKYTHNQLKRDNTFFYEDGYMRITFNTKTGYTYSTLRGHAYKHLQALSRDNKKVPYMCNSTYQINYDSSNIISLIAQVKVIDKYRQKDKEELSAILKSNYPQSKHQHEINQCEFGLTKEIGVALHKQIQSNFSYKIPTLKEYYEAYTEVKPREELILKERIINIFKSYNRFVNINPFPQASWLLINHDQSNCNKIHREEVNMIAGIYKAHKVKIGKKARALTQGNYSEALARGIAAHGIAFKNPDNIYKFLKACKGNISRYYEFAINLKATQLWLQYRSENYVVNEVIQCICKEPFRHGKMQLMRDSVYMISMIKQNLGDDFDINKIVKFKNEVQFHDDINRFFNSDEYFMLVNKEQYKRAFELEQEILALEKPEENIFISTNRGQLSEIGRNMNICVGSYGDLVEHGQCRIAYVTNNNNDYIACIELRPIKDKGKKTYSIVQAKLKYNKLVNTDANMYNKIYNWAVENNLIIDTPDMEIKEVKEYA